jgi:hypothetical protein
MSLSLKHLEFCLTERQRQIVELSVKGLTLREIAAEIGGHHANIHKTVQAVKKRAAGRGYSPNDDLTHPTAPGFTTKRVSTAYKEDGTIALQWHIQEPEKIALEEMVAQLTEGLRDELKGVHKPLPKPTKTDNDLMACYLIGDHHIGMYAWGEEAGEDWDVDKSEKILEDAVDRLVASSPSASIGTLINLGDFFHIQDSTSTTASSKHLLDSDGRWGRTIRAGTHLIKRVVLRMLQKHKYVQIVNARGNHDPDAALFLNTAIQMYFEHDKRVTVLDNFNKFVWFTFGQNLIVTHHGDKINANRLYEAITRNLRKEWGESRRTYCWLGHIHHQQSKEMGGMVMEHWNILPPTDAWHNASGYGADRSMTCVVLHKDFGEVTRLRVTAEALE